MKKSLTLFALIILLVGSFALAGPGRGKAEAPSQNQGPTIVDVALSVNAATGEFTLLIAALGAADASVLETLGGKGQFTVFAPTDAAFSNLLTELEVTLDQVVGDQALLTEILLYHVAPGSRYAEDVLASNRIRTLNKSFIFQEGGVLTDQQDRNANIIATDIPATNGVIHVIDAVILP